MMFENLKNTISFKALSVLLAINLLFQIGFPTIAYALTSGPSQEEFASFEPASTSDLVNLYTGDFTYNIPLLNVPGPNGGYPINLAYHGGVGMEQEASWVGLGWNINVGAINRQLRGVPDDFSGDVITSTLKMKKDWTVGFTIHPTKKEKIFGIPQPTSNTNISTQVYYNTYKGLGARVNYSIGTSEKVVNVGLGLSFDSQSGGIGISPNVNFIQKIFNFSLQYYSNKGLTDINFSTSVHNLKKEKKDDSKEESKKERKTKFNLNNTTTIGFSYDNGGVSVPNNEMIINNWDIDFSIGQSNSYGIYKAKLFEYLYLKGFYNESNLSNDGTRELPSIGLLHHLNSDKNSIQDYIKYPLSYSKKVPNLAPSAMAYDIFSQTGQGSGGMFRVYTDYTPIFSPPTTESQIKNKRILLEFGSGSSNFHLGLGFSAGGGEMVRSAWRDEVYNISGHTSDFTNHFKDGKSYFQEYGEKSSYDVVNEFVDNSWLNELPVRAKIEQNGASYFKKNYKILPTVQNAGSSSSSPKQFKEGLRIGKNISYLTIKQARKYGFDRSLYNNLPLDAKGHHIGQITITQQDGTKYIYGLPQYNTTQKEVQMSVPTPPPSGLYNGKQIDINNNTYENTFRKYYSEKIIPPYVNTWLLTAVVSADYIDRTMNGPTDDDYGYWVKFNYTKVHDNYKWRVPYIGAFYEQGFEDDETDDIASFQYGTKQIYILTSIETKTHKAVFITEDRDDSYEAFGEYAQRNNNNNYNNEIGTKSLKKLNEIKLYKKDLSGGTNDFLIKTVHFEYDYSLCKYVPNNINYASNNINPTPPELQGKLTLKKVYFTYEQSNRGSKSPYVFEYGNSNANYNVNDMDKWGNYVPNSSYPTSYPHQKHPYIKEELYTNNNVAPWDLTKIILPTGGELNIEHEHDDYSYIETEEVTKMYPIAGVGEDIYDLLGNKTSGLMEDSEDKTGNNLTKLNEKSNNGTYKIYFYSDNQNYLSAQEVIDKFIGNNKKIWFRNYTLLKTKNLKDRWAYVSGFADVYFPQSNLSSYFGTQNINGKYYYFISIKPIKLTKILGTKVNPMQKAALTYLKTDRPDLLTDNITPTNSGNAYNQIMTIFSAPSTAINSAIDMVIGYYNHSYAKGYGNTIRLNGRSEIRLLDDDLIKKGGGYRVRKLYINDVWSSGNANYGQTYDYTMTENGATISSGVAYEPSLGYEETPQFLPVEYSESLPFGTVRSLFVAKPVLRMFYPSAQVGYRKVTVKSIAPEEALADNNNNYISPSTSAQPIMIYEFYSPKDFPVITNETAISADPPYTRLAMIPGAYSEQKKSMARSQGYSVVLNDMAGKPKSTSTLERYTGVIISKQEFIYQTKNQYNPNGKNELNNIVKIINEDGDFIDAVIGQSVDTYFEWEENYSENKSFGLDLNFEFQIPLMTLPIPLPVKTKQKTSLKTVVAHKIIYKTGVIKAVKTTERNYTLTQENIAFDPYSGTPVLTKTTNEYEDPIYNYKIFGYTQTPVYETMGSVNKRIDNIITNNNYYPSGYRYNINFNINTTNNHIANIVIAPASVNITYPASLFHAGDIIGLYDGTTTDYGVINNVSVNGNTLALDIEQINGNGFIVSSNLESIANVKPVFKNQFTTEVGNIVAQELTVNGTDISFDKIVNASAVEYSDVWPKSCLQDCYSDPKNTPNDYVSGRKGVWRPYKAYQYRTERLYKNESQNDGFYAKFTPFNWNNVMLNDPNWIVLNTITKYSPYGFELENKDPLGNYSAALYGYHNSLATAIAKNAKYNEIAFDSFEEENQSCNSSHFSFILNNDAAIIDTEAHSGNKSLKISNGATQTITVNL